MQTLTAANVAGFIMGTAMFSMFLMLTLYMQQVLGYSPIKTGVAYLAVAGTAIIWANVAAVAVNRVGVKPALILGMGLLTAGLVYFTQVSVDGSYWADLFPGFLILGVAIPFAFVPITIAALAGTKPQEAGLASGLINTSQQIGGAVGIAILSTIAVSTTDDAVADGTAVPVALTDGFVNAFWAGAGIALAGLLVSIFMVRGRDLRQEAPVAEPAFEGPPRLRGVIERSRWFSSPRCLMACGGENRREADPMSDQKLIEAARAGDAEEVRALLEQGARVDAADSSGATALVAAAYGNHVEVARLLIEAGADVDAKDATEQSAYLIATSEVGDDTELLELTLDAGADVNAKDSYNGTGLIRAADRGHVQIVRRLLETDIDVDHVNRLGWTALLEAIILGGGDERHVETVRVLVDGGVDVNLADGDGVSPLAHARAHGYDEMVAILTDAGATMP